MTIRKKIATKKASKESKLTVEKHESIRSKQKKISADFSGANPSEVFNIPWIYARRKKGKYPESKDNCGKWLIYVYEKNIDIVWKLIKTATKDGLLGDASKVSTGMPSPLAPKANLKVICVYTYDYTDKTDVMKIREQLRKIGVTNKIPYKTDNATRAGNYTVAGKTRISTYYE